MKPRKIVMITLVFISLILQSAGIFAIMRAQDTNNAYELRETALKHLPYVSGRASSAGNLTASESCVIFTMPSFFGGVVSDKFSDTLAIHIKSGRLFFSFYPAEGSDRKHETVYINRAESFNIREVDGFMYIELRLSGMERTFNFYRPRGLALVSEGGAL